MTIETFTATQCASDLPLIAGEAIQADKQKGQARETEGHAEARMIAGFSDDSAATLEWVLEIKGNDNVVHHHAPQSGIANWHTRENQPAMRNGEGAISKTAQGVYKRAFQHAYFNLVKPVEAVWTMAKRAVGVAVAIREEGMTASVVNGKLVLEGGTSAKAQAMRDADSLAKLRKACGLTASGAIKGDASRGTSEGEGEGEGATPSATRPATPSEITAATLQLCKDALTGDAALCNVALENLQAIAKLVTSKAKDNIAAFTLDD
tara:strand:- start:96 stop:887 length:792 start_codon:yes stop_codon:yes gene_type:complete